MEDQAQPPMLALSAQLLAVEVLLAARKHSGTTRSRETFTSCATNSGSQRPRIVHPLPGRTRKSIAIAIDLERGTILALYTFGTDCLAGRHGMNLALRGLCDWPARMATALVILDALMPGLRTK